MAKSSSVIAGKRPIATGLTSKQIARLDRETRARALISARTTEQRYVAKMQGVLEAFTSGDIGEGEARKRLLSVLDDFGYTPEAGFPDAEKIDPAKPGTIQDLSSYGRLNLVADTNAGMAASVSRLAGETPETLALFPAWRLARFMSPNGEPRDWALRWAVAGESVGWHGACPDEMVARKDSPIWQALGDGVGGFSDTLGNPYPPFAFNSGMGWEDVDRDEAAALGIDLDAPVRPDPPSLAVRADEIERAGARYGDEFSQALADVLAMYNEDDARRCPADGAFLTAHGECHSQRHGGHAASAAYDGYRKMASERPESARRAEEQLAAFRDRTTGMRCYRDIEDLFSKAMRVTPERIGQIAGGFNDVCAVHEAVAVLTASPRFRDSVGNEVLMKRWLVSHYMLGDRRRGNEPKVESLRELPRAVMAIRTRVPSVKASRSGATQFQYSMARPKMNAYVYCDSGVVSGWHVVRFMR